jgi:hypothetical protein
MKKIDRKNVLNIFNTVFNNIYIDDHKNPLLYRNNMNLRFNNTRVFTKVNALHPEPCIVQFRADHVNILNFNTDNYDTAYKLAYFIICVRCILQGYKDNNQKMYEAFDKLCLADLVYTDFGPTANKYNSYILYNMLLPVFIQFFNRQHKSPAFTVYQIDKLKSVEYSQSNVNFITKAVELFSDVCSSRHYLEMWDKSFIQFCEEYLKSINVKFFSYIFDLYKNRYLNNLVNPNYEDVGKYAARVCSEMSIRTGITENIKFCNIDAQLYGELRTFVIPLNNTNYDENQFDHLYKYLTAVKIRDAIRTIYFKGTEKWFTINEF